MEAIIKTIDEEYECGLNLEKDFINKAIHPGAGRGAHMHVIGTKEVLKKSGGRCPHDKRQGVQIRRFKQGADWIREFRCPKGHIFQEVQ
jgi:hypothetical protein